VFWTAVRFRPSPPKVISPDSLRLVLLNRASRWDIDKRLLLMGMIWFRQDK
jgi:hypothetical protein